MWTMLLVVSNANNVCYAMFLKNSTNKVYSSILVMNDARNGYSAVQILQMNLKSDMIYSGFCHFEHMFNQRKHKGRVSMLWVSNKSSQGNRTCKQSHACMVEPF